MFQKEQHGASELRGSGAAKGVGGSRLPRTDCGQAREQLGSEAKQVLRPP
jgi:hypothetical protein